MAVKAKRRPLDQENQALRARLLDLEETLRAIRSGEVDALVVETAGENRVFTLKSADETYRLMVEQMPMGAATLSDDGVVLHCNPFLASLLDVPVEAVSGAPISNFLDQNAAVGLSALLQNAEFGVSRGEISFRRGKGSVLTDVSLTELPLDGAPVYCIIVTDLTERKRHEEERSQLEREQAARAAAEAAHLSAQEEIERRKDVEASLRHAEMERTDLYQLEQIARAEAEAANRLKDEFLATLSHELRTPLSAILTWAHILRQPGLDPAHTKRAAEAIERGARAQTAIVADLLDVSKIVTGQFHMSLQPVRLPNVIKLATEAVGPAARIKDVRLEVTIDPAVAPVLGDATRLQQVIWNLLSNAIRSAPTGGLVEVRVALAGGGVELSVSDNGAGIEESFLPHVFDRFRQADSSTTRRHSGLGLGLAIVRHLVEMHGGSVAAQNHTGRAGAVFMVRLPQPPEGARQVAAGAGDEASSRRGGVEMDVDGGMAIARARYDARAAARTSDSV